MPGQTILIEYRFSDGTTAETVRLAREIVNLKVDVILAGGGRATQAAQGLTTTIPIVMTSASDPVGTGLVASLAHPGGNTTGTSIVSWELFANASSCCGRCFRMLRASPFSSIDSIRACHGLGRSVGRGSETGRDAPAHRRGKAPRNSMRRSPPWPGAEPMR